MPNQNSKNSKLTSFEKGIKKRLSKERLIIEWIIGEYIIRFLKAISNAHVILGEKAIFSPKSRPKEEKRKWRENDDQF